MKRYKIMTAVLAMSLLMASCSAANEQNETSGAAGQESGANAVETNAEEADGKEQEQAPSSAYCFEVKGKKIAIDSDTSTFLTDLGDPDDYFESESCAFQGLDKVYTYKDFVIYTYPDGDKDLVSSIELTSDAVTTAEGAYLGMSADELKALYSSAPSEEGDEAITYKDGDTVLSFIMSDGAVESITYSMAE